MTPITDPALQSAIDALAVPGVLVAHRLILPGDEDTLMTPERPALATSVVKVRRASGTARIVARALLAQLGHARCPVPKAPSGAPVWPSGIVGSLAHDDRVAVAAIARRLDIEALGIDVEPAEMLPSDLLEMVATPRERLAIAADPYRGRLIFAAKEAVYKAVNPLDQVFLDHHDVEVDLAGRTAVVRDGREVALRFAMASHLVALAFIRAR
jgi:4'-phosphopantetheinyl transferase EntD